MKTYEFPVYTGRQYEVKCKKTGETQVVRASKGIVVATVADGHISIGWSLCNSSTSKKVKNGQTILIHGDRFNPTFGRQTALGRAMSPHKNNVKGSVKTVPTNKLLIEKGVPQSTLEAISEVMAMAWKAEKGKLNTYSIYNEKSGMKARSSKKAWTIEV